MRINALVASDRAGLVAWITGNLQVAELLPVCRPISNRASLEETYEDSIEIQ